MADVNLYKVLGVARSASADEIKSAYRELVKRYHPDLFSSPGAKAKATETLRQINEAYAVLGNAERRRRYDQESAPKPQPRARQAAPSPTKRPPRPARRQAGARRKSVTIPRIKFNVPKKWAGYSVAAATVILLLVYAGRSEPRLALAWTLWEKLEVLPLQSTSSSVTSHKWTRLSEHASMAECSALLRKIVKDDERAGSRAVFDENGGTMAITVYVEKESSGIPPGSTGEASEEAPPGRAGLGNPEGERPSDLVDGAAAERPSGGTKRVRNLECRVTERLESDSLLRRALRKIGLFS